MGPLSGLRIIELAGIGPGPFACMMLADHGAEVIRIDRPGGVTAGPAGDPRLDVLLRSRRTICVDLKSAEGKRIVLDLVAGADGLIEGFRPGVAERLGFGPDELLSRNPALVYGRMTGWGQTGPYARAAGHDINYIALNGALHAFGRAGQKPTSAINTVADFGGGGMMLAFAMVSALLHARSTGVGQVVDCAMSEGASLLMAMTWTFRAQDNWSDARGTNLLDTGAHFYDTYETSDGKHVAIGAIEPQFYALLRSKLGIEDDSAFDPQMDRSGWEALRGRFEAIFAQRTRDEWCQLLEHTDACFAPVLSFDEAVVHPHNVARDAFVTAGGVVQPAPAPRYSVSQTRAPSMFDGTTESEQVLRDLGYDEARVSALLAEGCIS